MREHMVMAHTNEAQFAKVRVGREVLHSVHSSPQQPKRLVLFRLILARTVPASHIDAFQQPPPNQRLGGIPPPILVRDIILHTSA